MMTVKDLRQALEGLDDECEVRFAYNYGDHGKTLVAASLEYLDDGRVKWSDYHNMDVVVADEDWDDDDAKQKSVVILF